MYHKRVLEPPGVNSVRRGGTAAMFVQPSPIPFAAQLAHNVHSEQLSFTETPRALQAALEGKERTPQFFRHRIPPPIGATWAKVQ